MGLNIFEYIGIGDIVSHALMPFMITVASLLFGCLLAEFSGFRQHFPPGAGANTTIGRFLVTHRRQLAVLDLAAIAVVVAFGREPLKWLLVAALMIPLASIPSRLELFVNLIPNRSFRILVVDMSLMVAALAFAQGRLQADFLLRGAAPLLVDVVGSGLQLKSDATHPVSYVAHVADFFVLYDSAQSQIVLLNTQKVNSLVLIKNPKAAF